VSSVRERGVVAALFLLLTVAWGLNYLFVRWGLGLAPPLWLATLRAGVGAASVAIILPALGPRASLAPPAVRDAMLIGIVNTGLFFGLWFEAAGSIPPGETAVLVYTFPLWVTLLSFGARWESISLPRIGAVALGFLGVVLVSQPWSGSGDHLELTPVLEALGGAVAWALGTVLFRRRFRGAEVPTANLWQLVGGTVALGLAGVTLEPHGFAPSPSLVPIVLWLGVIGTGVAYLIWFWLLDHHGAVRLSAYVFLVPVVALAASVVLLGESIDPIEGFGIALILVSLYGTATGFGKPDDPTSSA
jgi:drug/metabolite transporter (DMT)-like permease